MKRALRLLLIPLLSFAVFFGCGPALPDTADEPTAPADDSPVAIATPDSAAATEVPVAEPSEEPTDEPRLPDATPEEPVPEGGRAWSLTALGLDENVTFDQSGVGDAVTVSFLEKQGANDSYSQWLEVDGTTYDLKLVDVFFCGAWLYVENGVHTLMVCVDMASTDFETICFRLVDGKPVKTGTLFGLVETATEDGEIVIGRPVDVLGTWWATRPYTMDGDGKLVPAEGSLYEIVPGEDIELRTNAKLPVELLVGTDYKPAEVPARTRLTPLATDDKAYFYFILDDGREGRIPFERNDYCIYIAGEPETDYFDELHYSG